LFHSVYLLGVLDPEVTGKVGQVILRVRGGEQPGEVLVSVRGGTEAFIAFAKEPIERDTDVLVVGYRGDRCVDVEPWPYAEVLDPFEARNG
jgi:hypothetical protein